MQADIGRRQGRAKPAMEMIVRRSQRRTRSGGFDRQLFIIRKVASHRLRDESKLSQALLF